MQKEGLFSFSDSVQKNTLGQRIITVHCLQMNRTTKSRQNSNVWQRFWGASKSEREKTYRNILHMRQIKSSRSPTSLPFLEKLKIFMTSQRKSLSQDILLEREKVTRNFPGSLWCNNMPSTYSAWYERIPSVLRTAVHHQKRMVILLWDFTNLNWKISLFKLLYLLEAITLKFSYFWLLSQQNKSKLCIHEFFCPYKLFGHICISSLGWCKDHGNGTTYVS